MYVIYVYIRPHVGMHVYVCMHGCIVCPYACLHSSAYAYLCAYVCMHASLHDHRSVCMDLLMH
jgi:hypothetical protein